MNAAISFIIGVVAGSGTVFGTSYLCIVVAKRRFARRVGVKPSEVNSEWTTSDYRT